MVLALAAQQRIEGDETPMQHHADEVLYPLRFVTLPKEKVWGGHKIARTFQRELSADRPIGEVWVVWDELAVANGPQRGKKLADLVRSYPLPILGSRLATRQPPQFPLLVKVIDARDTLSVQVHPDDAYASQHEGEPFGKSEVWYILDAEPEARLIHGVKKPLTCSEVEGAIESGTLQEMLDYVPVSAGDVIYNPPGTIHALGRGLLLYELQQSSDLTYRLYDWDRRDPNRPLHIEKSLDVACLEPFSEHKIEPVEIQEPGATRAFLCACSYFAAELLTVRSHTLERPAGTCFHALTVLKGTGCLQYGKGPVVNVLLNSGESLLVPASIHEYRVQAEEPLMIIKAYVPDLLQDVVRPLRKKGVAESTILQLAGASGDSDLAPYLS
jgi:mannose-6-phosphate isomerase